MCFCMCACACVRTYVYVCVRMCVILIVDYQYIKGQIQCTSKISAKSVYVCAGSHILLMAATISASFRLPNLVPMQARFTYV